MHELAVTESLLEIAVRHGQAAGARRITALHLVIGDLSSIVDECVQFYWDIISRGSLAEGAELRFRRVPARFACTACGHEYQPTAEGFGCPRCQASGARVLQGEEFHLEAIDIETADEGTVAAGATAREPERKGEST